MPYVKPKDREHSKRAAAVFLNGGNRFGLRSLSAGQMTYLVTKLVSTWMPKRDDGSKSFDGLADVIKVLECAKLEFYRRMAAPHEDLKMKENGDVYS